MKHLKFLALSLLFTIFAPVAAQAFDIPLLTWERGREQQVVLGGGAYTQEWKVTLEGEGQPIKTFAASQKNAAGYVVYSIYLPADFPLGSYSVVTNGVGSPRTIVAGVNVIAAQTNTAASNLFDLTLIIAIFVFITGIISTIRARKYAFIPFRSTQLFNAEYRSDIEGERNFWDRLEEAPYRLRIESINSLNPSLLRFLLIREGELAHRLSRQVYGLAPVVALLAGAIAAIESIRNNGIALTPITIFLVISAIAIFDAFSGIAATLGFWAVQIVAGRITSFRDLLIALAIGIAWIGPSLFAALLRETISRDFTWLASRNKAVMTYLGIIGSGAIGSALFYFGHSLVNSVIYTEHEPRAITLVHLGLIALMLILRGVADVFILDRETISASRDESFVIARISSPITAIATFSMVFGFVFIWTESASRAFFVALLFTLPYLLIFIRFNEVSWLRTAKISRNLLLESALISLISFIVFRQISLKPLLLDQRADLLLLLTGVAPLLHAVFSAIYASNEAKFSFEENPEIIKP